MAASAAAIASCAAARADKACAPVKGEDGRLVIKPGQRTFTDEEDQGILAHLVAVLSLLLFVAWPMLLLVILGIAFYLRSTAVWTCVILLFSSAFWPVKPHWQWFLDLWVFKTWRQYFDFSFIFKVEPPKTEPHNIICEFPHGVFPLGPLVAGTCVDMLFPSMKVYGVMASSLLRVPVYRHVMSWFGGRPATKKNFKRLLELGSCACIAGGVAEMYMEDEHKERIKLLSRKGFIRVAVEQGCQPVPVYHFGNSQLLFILGKALEGLSRAIRASLVITYGKFGLPLPKRVPIMMVVGEPIKLKKLARTDPGFSDEVDRVHAAFVKALQDLYNEYRGTYGWADRELSIE